MFVCVIIRERLRTRSTEWQLEDQGDPGQQPRPETLREHSPLEVSRPFAARLQTLVIGDLRGARLVGSVREPGPTSV